MKILILDDEPVLLKLLEVLVGDCYEDAEIFTAENGDLAMELMDKHGDIDLVITDLHGCRSSGVCCRALGSGIRLVVCTGGLVDNPKFKEILYKPFSLTQIETLLKKGA